MTTRLWPCSVACVFCALFLPFYAIAVEAEVAELVFDGSCAQSPEGTNSLPKWIRIVEQQNGEFADQPACWHVDSSQPAGNGRLSLVLDREVMKEDLAMSILYEETWLLWGKTPRLTRSSSHCASIRPRRRSLFVGSPAVSKCTVSGWRRRETRAIARYDHLPLRVDRSFWTKDGSRAFSGRDR